MLRQYETTFILDAHQSDEQINVVIDKISKLIEKEGGNIHHIDRWGKRRLAYEIARKQYGYYVYFRFEVDGSALLELDRVYKLDENIIRFLTVKITKAQLKEEARQHKKEAAKKEEVKAAAEAREEKKAEAPKEEKPEPPSEPEPEKKDDAPVENTPETETPADEEPETPKAESAE